MNFTKIETPSEPDNILDDGSPARKFKWVAEIEIDEVWVQDGFDLTAERLKEVLLTDLGFATSNEVNAKILKCPNPEEIRKTQGG